MARFLAWYGVCFGFQFESGFEFRLGQGESPCRRRGQGFKDLASAIVVVVVVVVVAKGSKTGANNKLGHALKQCAIFKNFGNF